MEFLNVSGHNDKQAVHEKMKSEMQQELLTAERSKGGALSGKERDILLIIKKHFLIWMWNSE